MVDLTMSDDEMPATKKSIKRKPAVKGPAVQGPLPGSAQSRKAARLAKIKGFTQDFNASLPAKVDGPLPAAKKNKKAASLAKLKVFKQDFNASLKVDGPDNASLPVAEKKTVKTKKAKKAKFNFIADEDEELDVMGEDDNPPTEAYLKYKAKLNKNDKTYDFSGLNADGTYGEVQHKPLYDQGDKVINITNFKNENDGRYYLRILLQKPNALMFIRGVEVTQQEIDEYGYGFPPPPTSEFDADKLKLKSVVDKIKKDQKALKEIKQKHTEGPDASEIKAVQIEIPPVVQPPVQPAPPAPLVQPAITLLAKPKKKIVPTLVSAAP
jgi:hypothetical protein